MAAHQVENKANFLENASYLPASVVFTRTNIRHIPGCGCCLGDVAGAMQIGDGDPHL